VTGTIGEDMRIEVNGKVPSFENQNFGDWNDWSTAATTRRVGSLDPNKTGLLRGKDTLVRLFLDESYATQVSFLLEDPSQASTAIIEASDGKEMTIQIGANSGKDQTVDINIKSLSTVSLGIDMLHVCGHIPAQAALASVENAITMVSTQRSELGSVQNRLEHSISGLDTISENLQNAESRIRDTDMARGVMDFTKENILMQSSQAMLAQANNFPQGVLQLIQQ
jgi:flagellin